MLKESAKSVIRTLTSPLVRDWPITKWPGWLGRIHGVKVPAALPRQSQAAPTGQANITILIEMIERTKSLDGAIADCGVYKAASTLGMALYMRQNGIQKRIYAFDSFRGFEPESVVKDLELGGAQNEDRNEHGFSDTTLDEVKSKIRRFGVNNIEIVSGFFDQSLKTFPRSVTFSFAHLDVNLYESYRECLEFFYPRVERGGIILFDEYNDPPWPGCNKAIEEFIFGKPEHLEMICRNNYQKWYFVKQ